MNGTRYSWLDLFAMQFGMLTSFLQRFLRGASKKRKLAESLGKDTPGDAKLKRSFKLSKRSLEHKFDAPSTSRIHKFIETRIDNEDFHS